MTSFREKEDQEREYLKNLYSEFKEFIEMGGSDDDDDEVQDD